MDNKIKNLLPYLNFEGNCEEALNFYKNIFDQLAAEGKIGVAFEKQFWGQWHGNIVDKYGIRWMVNC